MWKIMTCIIMSLAIVQGHMYTNYTVFTTTPFTQEELVLLRRLETKYKKLSLRESSGKVGSNVDIMVPPEKLAKFYDAIEEIGVTYRMVTNNLQELIDSQNNRRPRAAGFNFESYHTLDTIYEDLHYLANQFPENVDIIIGGETHEKRLIKGVRLVFNFNKPGVFLEGGIHGNEWISTATVMYILHTLLTSSDEDIRELADNHDWYIFPVFNPDGYVFTHTTDRMWRKTRTRYSDACIGVNLDRNWGFTWNIEDDSKHHCTDNFPGTHQFSEVEARTMADYIHSISDKFYAYISFRGYGQYLLFPQALVLGNLEIHNKVYAIAIAATAGLAKRYGTRYQYGTIPEILHVRTGSTINYIQRIYGKRLVFEYLLRDKGRYRDLLPADKILQTGKETLDSLVALFQEAKNQSYPEP